MMEDPRTPTYLLAAIALGVWFNLVIAMSSIDGVERHLAKIERTVDAIARR